MFILTTISDLVQIAPEDFSKPAGQCIEDGINSKFANKVPIKHAVRDFCSLNIRQVIQKVGLCICVYDILKASHGLIGHGTGIVNVNGMLLFILRLLKLMS